MIYKDIYTIYYSGIIYGLNKLNDSLKDFEAVMYSEPAM